MTKNVIDLERMGFEDLHPQELSRRLMQLKVKERLQVILQRADSEEVVASMPEQDFALSVKEIGAEDALPFLALARVDQLNHLFDLEWWQKYTLVPARALEWLHRLAKASEEKLLAWLYHVDFELLVSLFKKWITLSMAPEDMDPLEAGDQLPPHTLDDTYFWDTRYPQYEHFIGQLLSLLFEVHQGFYRELMNSVLYAVDAETEEEAYQFHRGRLEDLAIPDYDNALEIYRFIRPEEIAPAKNILKPHPDDRPAPAFALALLHEGDFLSRVLHGNEQPALMDSLQLELASLANKVVVADQLSLDNPETLHRAVDKATAYASLGLEIKAHGNAEMGLKTLREVYLEHLFRLGHTQVAKLRGRMRKLAQQGWLSYWPKGLKCLEPEWMEGAELLLQRTPRYLRPVKDPGGNTKQAFAREDHIRTREDLFAVKHFIDVIISLGPLFRATPADPQGLSLALWQEGQIRTLDEVTLGALIWTAAARFQFSGSWEALPIPAKAWPAWFPVLQPPILEPVIRSWVAGVLPAPGHRILAEAYLNPLFEAYSAETASFGPANPPDARLVKFFLFREE